MEYILFNNTETKIFYSLSRIAKFLKVTNYKVNKALEEGFEIKGWFIDESIAMELLKKKNGIKMSDEEETINENQ